MQGEKGLKQFRVDLEESVCTDFAKYFNYGTRRQAVTNLLVMACEAVKNGGPLMLGAILSGQLTLAYNPSDEQTLAPSEEQQ